MELQAGDVLLLGTVEELRNEELRQVKDTLKESMPGVEVLVIDGVRPTVLRYRPADPTPDAEREAYYAEIARAAVIHGAVAREAMTMARGLLRAFSEKGSIGGVDNVLRSTWLDAEEIAGKRRQLLSMEQRMRGEDG